MPPADDTAADPSAPLTWWIEGHEAAEVAALHVEELEGDRDGAGSLTAQGDVAVGDDVPGDPGLLRRQLRIEAVRRGARLVAGVVAEGGHALSPLEASGHAHS